MMGWDLLRPILRRMGNAMVLGLSDVTYGIGLGINCRDFMRDCPTDMVRAMSAGAEFQSQRALTVGWFDPARDRPILGGEGVLHVVVYPNNPKRRAELVDGLLRRTHEGDVSYYVFLHGDGLRMTRRGR